MLRFGKSVVIYLCVRFELLIVRMTRQLGNCVPVGSVVNIWLTADKLRIMVNRLRVLMWRYGWRRRFMGSLQSQFTRHLKWRIPLEGHVKEKMCEVSAISNLYIYLMHKTSILQMCENRTHWETTSTTNACWLAIQLQHRSVIDVS